MRIPKKLVEIPMEHGIYKSFFEHLETMCTEGNFSKEDVVEAMSACRYALDTYRDSPEFKSALLGLKKR